MVALYGFTVTPSAGVGGALHSVGLPEEQKVTGVECQCIIDICNNYNIEAVAITEL